MKQPDTCHGLATDIAKENPKYVLQERDNNTGELSPTQYSRMLGEKELVLVRPEK